jgi:nitrite reductase/ring-hydroxylating ferredoxin subunit
MPFISRKNFIAVMAIAALQLKMPFLNAAVGPTLKPTRLGQTIIWRGKKYTAIKSGKKLIWNKGVAIPVKKTTPKATPKASPTATPSSRPSSTPQPSASPSPEVKPAGLFEVDVAGSGEVANGETKIFMPNDSRLKGKAFIITRDRNSLIAFDNNCTHETCPVELGTPDLMCYCHDSSFNRITGHPTGGIASEPLKKYPVKEVAGRIVVTDSY